MNIFLITLSVWLFFSVITYIVNRWSFSKISSRWTTGDRAGAIFLSLFGPVGLMAVIGAHLMVVADWSKDAKW